MSDITFNSVMQDNRLHSLPSSFGTHQDSRNFTTSGANYMIKIDSLTKSKIDGFEEYTPLLAYETDISRNVNPIGGSALHASGTVHASHVSITIPTEICVATIENLMFNGASFKEIIVARLITIKETNTVAEQWTYTTNFFSYVRSLGDRTNFHFRYIEREHEVKAFNQEGESLGQNTSNINLNTNKVSD